LNQQRRHRKKDKKTSIEIKGLKHSMPDVVVAGSVVVGTSVVGPYVVGSTVVGSFVEGSTIVGFAIVGVAVVDSADAGSNVVGTTVVGAIVVGAAVVGGTAFPWIQSTYVFTFVYTPGRSCLAQPKPQDTTPANFPSQTKGPPLSP
jgi:hypothetical protein